MSVKDMTVREWLDTEEVIEGALIANGYDDCIIGFDPKHSTLVYDKNAIISKLAKEFASHDGADPDEAYDEAVEFFEYNIQGAYLGERTPIYIELVKFTKVDQGA
jgi:hypothetical protein